MYPGWASDPYVVEPCDGCPCLHLPTASVSALYVGLQRHSFHKLNYHHPPFFFRESTSCTSGWTQNVAEDDLGPQALLPPPLEFWGYRYASSCLGLMVLGSLQSGRQAASPALCLFFFLMVPAGGTSPEEITGYVELFSIMLLLRKPEKWEGKSKPYTSTCTPSAQWPFWI